MDPVVTPHERHILALVRKRLQPLPKQLQDRLFQSAFTAVKHADLATQYNWARHLGWERTGPLSLGEGTRFAEVKGRGFLLNPRSVEASLPAQYHMQQMAGSIWIYGQDDEVTLDDILAELNDDIITSQERTRSAFFNLYHTTSHAMPTFEPQDHDDREYPIRRTYPNGYTLSRIYTNGNNHWEIAVIFEDDLIYLVDDTVHIIPRDAFGDVASYVSKGDIVGLREYLPTIKEVQP